MSIHQIKLNYNKAWSSYHNFVQKWQRYANEPADSANNMRMTKLFNEQIYPAYVVARESAKLVGIRIHDECEALY